MIGADITHQILSQMVTGVIVLDSNKTIVYLNDWVKQRLEKPDQVLDKTLIKAFPELESSRLDQAISDVIKNRLPAFLSNSFHPTPLPLYENPTIGGLRLQQLLHLKPVIQEDEVYCLVQIQDMSSSVAREKVLKQQQGDLQQSIKVAERANAMKSDFLATMSHEIRTPLNGMIGSTSLLNLTEMSSEQSELVATVRQCGENLLAIINDILDFSKIESGHMQLEEASFNLRECIEDSFDLFVGNKNRKNIELYYDLTGMPKYVVGDITRFRQVIINLLSNAIKFTDEGEVALSSRILSDDEQQLIIEFTVKDSGIGISTDKQRTLFSPFVQADASTTREFGGTGLGLSICKSLVSAMSGEIRVVSQEGQGSEFIFTVQFKPSEENLQNTEQEYIEGIKDRRVMLIETNKNYRHILLDQCHQWGLEILEMAEFSQAKTHLPKDRPDLVLAGFANTGEDEVNFMSWYASQNELRKIPLLLLHNGLVDKHINEISNDDYTELLIKPVKRGQFLKTLFRYLAKTEGKNQTPKVSDVYKNLAAEYPGRILIVEDNQVNQKIVARMLNKLGYQVELASNGLEALDLAKEDNFDLVFMDVQMPKMDGLDATRAIRKLTKQQPDIVALTANAVEGDRERCIESGMNDYLAKPLTIENLRAMLMKHLS